MGVLGQAPRFALRLASSVPIASLAPISTNLSAYRRDMPTQSRGYHMIGLALRQAIADFYAIF